MNQTEQIIINIIKVFYDIDIEQEKKLIESFSKTSKEDKEKIAKELYIYYKKTNINLKNLLIKINKINVEIDEYKEKLNAENILNQIK